ncbi:MAG TPA: EAL domain-containing protein [Mycobacteriales bacterium]|nr:EAL domain-containing protein [Mycobacteriales bacterium]
MNLPWRARLVIGAQVLAAVVAAATVLALPHAPGFGPAWATTVIGALFVVAWARPLLVFRGSSSEAVQFDEGLLIVALIVLPPGGVLFVVGVGTIVGMTVRRRPMIKRLFNLAHTVFSAALAILVSSTLAQLPTHTLGPRRLTAAVVGAAVFFLATNLTTTLILVATGGGRARDLSRKHIDLRLAMLGAGVVLGSTCAAALSVHPWTVVLLPLPFLTLRFAMAGHFAARHDRDRLLGLFDATLSVHRPIDAHEVGQQLTATASELLRCSSARLSSTPPVPGEIATSIVAENGTSWLALSGRSRSEPFDAADEQLLAALAAVGSSALRHAAIHATVSRQQERLAAIMGSLAEGVIAFDPTGYPVFVNPAGEGLLGMAADELTARVHSLAAAEVVAPLSAIARRCLHEAHSVTDDSTMFTSAARLPIAVSYTCSPIYEGDELAGAVLAFRDITERVAAERELAYHAFHDQLTGLPNRRLFLDRLEQALRRSDRTGASHAVLFADVDRFKLINDNLGHTAGDELLCEIAQRLAVVLRPTDTIARFGGDEFTVLLEDVDHGPGAELLAARVRSALREPIRLASGREVIASVSIGIASTRGISTPDDVLHNADVAMYQAKTEGTGGVHHYDAAAMRARSAQRLDVEADLRRAVDEGQLDVHYQPLVDVRTEAIVELEALVRWRHPQHGLRMPAEFIPIAEESGLIFPLGRAVLAASCRQAREWLGAGADIGVAVNLSARQFQDPNLVSLIGHCLEGSDLPAHRLCLEITESLAMHDVDDTIRTLGRLKELGVRLAIDDFGTGYSSLSYLKRFPVDVVKIDRSFVRDLDRSDVDRAIVAAIVGLTDALGIVTVAEGVEDKNQLARLRTIGCGLAQGYHLARPASAAEISRLLGTPWPALPAQRPSTEVAHLRLAPSA